MAHSQNPTRFIVFSTLLVTLTFFVLMLLQGAPLSVTLTGTAVLGIITALLTTVSYAYKAYLQRRAFAGKKQAGQSIENHQERTVEIDVPVDIAFDLALDALKTLDRQRVPVPDDMLVKMEMWLPRNQKLSIRDFDRASGFIQAGLRASTLGIPEFVDFSRITIQLKKVDNTTTRVHIESQANTVFDTYDMGKNMHYVNQLALYLRKESQQRSAESRLQERDVRISDVTDDDSRHQHQANS